MAPLVTAGVTNGCPMSDSASFTVEIDTKR
jgi:hypothetical protein